MSTALANLTRTVNKLQPKFINDNYRRSDRFKKPVRVLIDSNRNAVNLSSIESEKEKEEESKNLRRNEHDYGMKADILFSTELWE